MTLGVCSLLERGREDEFAPLVVHWSIKKCKFKCVKMHFYIHQNDRLGELIKLTTTTCCDIGIGCWNNGKNKKNFFWNLQKITFCKQNNAEKWWTIRVCVQLGKHNYYYDYYYLYYYYYYSFIKLSGIDSRIIKRVKSLESTLAKHVESLVSKHAKRVESIESKRAKCVESLASKRAKRVESLVSKRAKRVEP